MATAYLTPGVYVEEISTGAKPIEAVGTSTAGFVGEAPDANRALNKSVAIDNWTQFIKEFATSENCKSTPLSHAVFGFFQNGGSRCYVVNIGKDKQITSGGREKKGLDRLEEIDEIAIVAAPGFTDAGSYDAVLTHCEKMKDRVAILDAPAQVSDLGLLTKLATATASSKKEESPPKSTAAEPSGMRPRVSDGGYGAFYFPHITVLDPLTPGVRVDVPPSGHIAGIYARTDATRGVHKAPANESIRGALNVTYSVTHAEQGLLNPEGINCIRLFPLEGIRVWGARTLAASSSEWRYVNVRRLFSMIEKSIARSTRWVVFEPNDISLWKSIRRDVSAFLTLLWREGALMGRTPEQAFFVQCDEETNPQEVIDAGRVVIVIGIAPVKPAEFVIFKIGQGVGGAEITS